MDQDVKKVIEKLQQDMVATNDAAQHITQQTSERAIALQQLETQLQSRKAEVEEYELENVEKQSHLRG